MSVDWEDPCARADALREVYYARISGTQEAEIRTRTLDAEEMTRFFNADLTILRQELDKADAECKALQNPLAPTLPRRFAIGFRSRGNCR